MNNVCLVIIFNHRFDANICKLEKIYKGRFSSIYYIVPFYDGTRDDVIPVYECSFRYSGYIAQAFPKIMGNYRHYFFVADDIIINPLINEENYSDWFSLTDKDSFITWRKPIGDLDGWGFGRRFMDPLPVLEWYNGTNWKDEIIKAEAAFKIAQQQGISKDRFSIPLKFIWNNRKELKRYPRLIILFFKILILGRQQSPYPVWGGYSDLFLISAKDMKRTSHMMGVFAGMNLYVEMAIPTAISLNCERIVEQSSLAYKAKLLWSNNERDTIQEENSNSYKNLITNWNEEILFIHPIKLSQWEV